MANMQNLEALIAQLEEYQTRHRARRQIEAMGVAVADQLLPVLQDESRAENTRWSVLSLYAAWRYQAGATAILAVARGDRGLHSEAIRALEAITGFEIGDDVDEWEIALADPAAYAARKAAAESLDPVEDEEDEEEEEACQIFRQALADLTSEFKWEEEGYLYMRFELPGGRKQQMVATFSAHDPSGNPVATVYTECGPATPQIRELIKRRNVTTRYGKFVLEGEGKDQKVVMREIIPLHQVTPNLVRDVVPAMAAAADALEDELTAADRI